MTPIPPPTGIPSGPPLSFDTLTLVGGAVAIVALAIMAIVLWATRTRSSATYTLRCPKHGVVASVVVGRRRDGKWTDVTGCSLCAPRHVDCDKRCLRLVA